MSESKNWSYTVVLAKDHQQSLLRQLTEQKGHLCKLTAFLGRDGMSFLVTPYENKVSGIDMTGKSD